ncbi:MAG: glycosyltransferase [Planctomycetes bacterium]|nr:glycosyltransferase [Planctomycetota bacterium]
MTVLRNGVDAERFRPLPMAECRRSLGLPQGGRVLVSVGFLVPRKGHSLLLRALALIPAAERPFTVIAGDGPEEGALRSLAADLGLAEQVRLLGAVEHDALAAVYSSADLSVLASSREGWPNVLLESMACGTPVVATAVHGSPEVVADESVGLLVEEQSAEALAGALQAALARGFDRERVRRYALGMSWRETSAGLERVFQEVLRRGPNGRRGAP